MISGLPTRPRIPYLPGAGCCRIWASSRSRCPKWRSSCPPRNHALPGAESGGVRGQPGAAPASAADRACQQQCEALSHRQRSDPPVEGGRTRSRDGHLLCPAPLPGAPHALATDGLIGINLIGDLTVRECECRARARGSQRVGDTRRAGRFRPVHASLEVKEVVVGEGERRRRYIVCRNLLEAARQRQHREEVLAALRQELARLDPQAPDQTKRACELVASKRYGRYLSRGPGGRLAIDPQAVRRAARMDGKYVLLTNDDTLTPEDVGVGYKAMMIIEACFRRLKTTGLRIRPVSHWTAHRIVSHVKLCVLALLLERAAEIRVGETWRNLRFALEEVKVVRYRVHGLTLVQSTRLTAQVTAYLKKLGVKPPPRVLSIENSSATP